MSLEAFYYRADESLWEVLPGDREVLCSFHPSGPESRGKRQVAWMLMATSWMLMATASSSSRVGADGLRPKKGSRRNSAFVILAERKSQALPSGKPKMEQQSPTKKEGALRRICLYLWRQRYLPMPVMPEPGAEGSPVHRQRLTLVLSLATLIAAFGSSFQYGYNVAAVNSPAELMKEFYNQTYYERNNNYINEFSLTLLWSVSVSMFPFGGFLGSLMVGPLVNKFGRKGTLLFNNIFSIVPAILMGCSEVARSFEMIIVSRLLVGICAGLSSNVVPMYLGELAPKNLRGALGVVPQLFITVGILVAQIFGLRSLLANKEGWPILLGLTGIPAALQLLLLPFFPESPRYLLIQKKDEVAAKNALKKLRGWGDVGSEMEEIRQEDEAEKAAGFISVLKLFSMRSLRWQVISIIILMGGQQLSGVNAIYYYADQIYLSAGVKHHDVQYVTVGTGAVNVLMTVCAVFVVELLGRRVLLLLGFSVCFAACCVLTAALALQDTISWMPYVSIACVICYVVGHALGPSPIPALLITEIFLQSSRPAAFMVGGSVHWLSNFAVGLIFPFIQVGLGPYSFIIFAVICLLTTVYIFLVVPETKGKTFMEINQIFTKMNKVSEVHPEKKELKDFPISASGL
ncbi:solute carrier family 2, facilitated glucose transporter member 5 isoform X1 [Mustela nigripes]|uniref:solute carrier family 2, facilitated glucose transporter member 5 isoform X1 n=1 Tax=Mustela nigripes TaxID=77151 RepID=UPI00281699F5|nr:solute carrier family 2, facilitated glucose transporter member 5 isoform X1 [Mustela nigripes]XP_059230877.1 solute carrier family 2, facilitated glucose transporter member 5 isoform X1 [Mustela nigripes]